MRSKCYDCPRTKEYIDMGGCPNCKATKLLMNTNTRMATCDICGATFGIPMAIEGLCYDDVHNKQHTISIDAHLSKEQLLTFSKLIGMNVVHVYQLFKNNSPVVLENVPMVLTHQIHNFLPPVNASISIQPTIDEYHMFEKCRDI